MKKSKKIIFLVLSIIAFALLCGMNKSEAATVLWPIGGDNAADTYIEYGYGPRTYKSQDYIDKCKRDYGIDTYEVYYQNYENHFGVDIFGNPNETYSVVAVTNGTVIGTSANYVNYERASTNYINRNQRRTYWGLVDGGGYGNFVGIRDDATGKCYFYAHLRAGTITVKKGDKVVAGQELGKMGSSGDSGHQHLHFEVRRSEFNMFTNPYGPYTYLTLTTGYGVQTENPVDYIGEGPEKEEEEEEVYINPIEGIASKKDLKTFGDINADGEFSLADAMLVLKLYTQRMAQLEDNYQYVDEYADVDQDGKITIADAQWILIYVVKLQNGTIDSNTTSIQDFYAENR